MRYLCGLLLAGAGLLACHPAAAPRRSLTFWAMGVEGEEVRTLVPEFEQRYPGTRVIVQSIPWSAAHEKLLTAFAGGALPDVAQLGNTWLPEFQAIGALLPLDQLIASSGTIRADTYFPGIWETNRMGDRIYGIPWYVDTRVLFYRIDLFRQAGISHPPSTWEEWLETCERIRQARPGTYPVFFPLIYTEWQVPLLFVLQNNGILLADGNARGALDDPRTVEALRHYLRFFERGHAPTRMTEFANLLQAFASGNIAMMITGPWNVGELRRRYPALESQWTTTPLPGHKNRLSVAGGSSLVIFSTCSNHELAWKWIEFLSEPASQFRFFQLTGDLPPRKDSWQLGIREDPKMTAFYEQLSAVASMPKIAEWEQVAVKIQEHLEAVVLGRRTLEEAIPLLNRDLDAILEKRRWLLTKGLLAE